MAIHSLKERIAAIGAVLSLSIALPFVVGVTPAYAQAQLIITKSRVGDFPRGGQGIYRITVANRGDAATTGGTHLTDSLPSGLTIADFVFFEIPNRPGFGFTCPEADAGGSRVDCETTSLGQAESYTVEVTVDIAADAPCTVTNTASVREINADIGDSASDTVSIPGPDCNGSNGGAGSLLPINLNGILPMYNNITTNNNVLSPGAANTSHQNFGVNAP
ncbi:MULTISPECIES: hypothetical protein [unclassified Streptomyces]|uniref:DUF7933 domain-containing protein n=1 Tax=unclassified Streptomyces TaxID=2593676 RepID=UPI0033AE6A63